MLVEELSPVNRKWEKLASILGVRGVKASYPSEGLFKVLSKWLDGRYVRHWSRVLLALRGVGEEHLASELKVNYGELSTIESSLICIDAQFIISGHNY